MSRFENVGWEDGLVRLEDSSIDLLVTDPPYFIPAVHYNTRTQFQRNFADLGVIDYFFRGLFIALDRVLKKDGRAYIFCDGQSYPIFFYHIYPYVKSARPLIWDKQTSINGYSWRHQHELILFAERREAKPIKTGDGDILRDRAVKVAERIHPAEKPISLLKRLIEKSSDPGSVVLDPFAGSGSTLVAAKSLRRDYIGFEKCLEYYNRAVARLEGPC